MTGDQPNLDSDGGGLFSVEQRQEALTRLLEALQTDGRIAGVIIIGSGAVGFDDEYSDIDLVVVVAADEDTPHVFRDWMQRIRTLFPVIHSFEVTYAENNYLCGFLLGGYLELDMGFLCLSGLSAKRARWRVAFDRSGSIEEIMRSTWESRPQPDVRAEYSRRLDSIWYHIIHTAIAAKREQPWEAIHHLEVIRRHAIDLAGMATGLDVRHFRNAHQLPGESLAELPDTLASDLGSREIMRALHAAARCFFREARALDRKLGLTLAADLERGTLEYLRLAEARDAQPDRA
jgi:predicted nucleotidyltransferase